MILEHITSPADLRDLDAKQLELLASEIRRVIVDTVTANGGHLGSNLGVVELTLAVHRTFESPHDAIIWDTGHQAYVHKLLTGRREVFATLRQEGGLSGYPSRAESEHDWIENSHASAALAYAHGLATAFRLAEGHRTEGHRTEGHRTEGHRTEGHRTEGHPTEGHRTEGHPDGDDRARSRRVVAIVGDGALTGGMAYEALNNLGHSGCPVVVVLNDNGRSYAPTVSRLSESLAHLRLNPSYVHARERARRMLRGIPAVGDLAYSGIHGLTAALREVITPHTFFEALGVRYAGPIDGHDIAGMEQALSHAAAWNGPIVVHVLTHKGRGYGPAEQDDIQRLHDFKVPSPASATRAPHDAAALDRMRPGQAPQLPQLPQAPQAPPTTYTKAFTRALLDQAARRPEIVAITAAMPGPTGLLPFQERFPTRFFDVGIAEQHAVAVASGMAMGGLRPVVAIYSTFLSRAFDQVNLDVGLHGEPVVLVCDRAGITGDDGPSHHGVLDMALALQVPGMTVFAPSSAEEIPVMLEAALGLAGPSLVRFPKTPARHAPGGIVGEGLRALRLRQGDGSACILAVGKMVEPAAEAATALAAHGINATVWDVRVVKPTDPELVTDASHHDLIVTVEDGTRIGGAGAFLAEAVSCHRPPDRAQAIRILGLPNDYILQAKPAAILSRLGLDAAGIAETVRAALTSTSDGNGRVPARSPRAQPPGLRAPRTPAAPRSAGQAAERSAPVFDAT